MSQLTSGTSLSSILTLTFAEAAPSPYTNATEIVPSATNLVTTVVETDIIENMPVSATSTYAETEIRTIVSTLKTDGLTSSTTLSATYTSSATISKPSSSARFLPTTFAVSTSATSSPSPLYPPRTIEPGLICRCNSRHSHSVLSRCARLRWRCNVLPTKKATQVKHYF